MAAKLTADVIDRRLDRIEERLVELDHYVATFYGGRHELYDQFGQALQKAVRQAGSSKRLRLRRPKATASIGSITPVGVCWDLDLAAKILGADQYNRLHGRFQKQGGQIQQADPKVAERTALRAQRDRLIRLRGLVTVEQDEE